jgi:hypothetical protein
VKTLDRNRIDGIVRELEPGAYRLALALASERASADRILLEAFSSLAPSLARTAGIVELRERLHARIRKRAARQRRRPATDEQSGQPVAVSESLHVRIVDLLEEEQADEPVGRRKAVVVGVIGILLVGAVVALIRVRSDALAAAQPTITGLSPAAGASDVPLGGEFRVTFGRRPAGTPTMRLNPATGKLVPARWEGNTLVARYSDLQIATRYELVLAADYGSSLIDLGRYERRWTLTTEGYPLVVALTPADGHALTTRAGQISVEFNYRPSVEPRISLAPADGTILPGQWSASTWSTRYTGLNALTRYQATITVDYGIGAANIRRQWAFTTEPGAPRPGLPVIWYGTRSAIAPQTDPQSLLAIDWQGNLAGTMDSTSAISRQAPDGSVLFTQDGNVLDRNGVPSAGFGFPFVGMMTDDSHSACTVGDPGGGIGGGRLWVLTGPVRGPLRRVAPADWAGAGPGSAVIACSVAGDRVVVADTGDRGLSTGIHVIALSSGRVLYQQVYAGTGDRIVSSRDGRYLADLTPAYDAQGQQLATPTMIRRIADGRVVARLDNQWVVGFSWDGMRVVTAPFVTFVTGVGTEAVRLVDWRTGKVLWQQLGGPPVNAMAQPNGPNMVIAIGSPQGGDVNQLWLVAADGHATQVVRAAFYPAFNGGF